MPLLSWNCIIFADDNTFFFFNLDRKQRLILLFFKARPKTLQVPGCPGPHSQDDPFTAQWGSKWCMLTLTCTTHSSCNRMTSRPRPSIFRPQPPSQVFLGWGTIPSTPPVTCEPPTANAPCSMWNGKSVTYAACEAKCFAHVQGSTCTFSRTRASCWKSGRPNTERRELRGV